jgi:hypothetical protein
MIAGIDRLRNNQLVSSVYFKKRTQNIFSLFPSRNQKPLRNPIFRIAPTYMRTFPEIPRTWNLKGYQTTYDVRVSQIYNQNLSDTDNSDRIIGIIIRKLLAINQLRFSHF